MEVSETPELSGAVSFGWGRECVWIRGFCRMFQGSGGGHGMEETTAGEKVISRFTD